MVSCKRHRRRGVAMAERPARREGFVARSDQPLVGVLVREDGQEVVYYSAADQPFRSAQDPHVQRALQLAGAWGEGDWDQIADALDRIRHESPPTPPIDLDT